MNRTILAVAAVTAVAVYAAPAASAYPTYRYAGDACRATLVVDETLTGQSQAGTVRTSAVATDTAGLPALVPISVDCVLVVNGMSTGNVLSASGTAAAAAVGRFEVQATASDTVEMCATVVVAHNAHEDCKPVEPPIEALSDVPANGSITITDAGTGAVFTKSYTPAQWSCVQVAGSNYVGMECTPTTTGINWVCAWVTVEATAGTPVPPGAPGAAGGRATCNTSGMLDTGVSTGGTTMAAAGALGPVVTFRCIAYGVAAQPTAPYTVTCAEPAAPSV